MQIKGNLGKSILAVQLVWHDVAYPYWLKKVLGINNDSQFNTS